MFACTGVCKKVWEDERLYITLKDHALHAIVLDRKARSSQRVIMIRSLRSADASDRYSGSLLLVKRFPSCYPVLAPCYCARLTGERRRTTELWHHVVRCVLVAKFGRPRTVIKSKSLSLHVVTNGRMVSVDCRMDR